MIRGCLRFGSTPKEKIAYVFVVSRLRNRPSVSFLFALKLCVRGMTHRIFSTESDISLTSDSLDLLIL